MPTYTPLQSIVLTSNTSSVTFSNIPQTYQDLVLVCSNIVPSGSMDVTMYVNGDTGTNYSGNAMGGDGGTARAGKVTNQSKMYVSDWWIAVNGTNPTMFNVNCINYSNLTTYKTFLSRGTVQGASAAETTAAVSLWRSTAAVTSITIQTSSGTMGSGATFDLYGVGPAGAQNASATGGTDIYYDSTYVYHVFKGSGTFTPARNLTCDYVVLDRKSTRLNSSH